MTAELSRESSWLRFNHRVLLQTRRPDLPLLERVRFLSIVASNHDEFFSARIYRALERSTTGGLKEQTEYEALLSEAYETARQASESHERLRSELAEIGLHLLEPSQLTDYERSYFSAFLAEEVAPKADLLETANLSELSSRALYLAAGRENLEYLVRLPESVNRLLPVPGRRGAFVRLGPLVRLRSNLFLPEQLPMYEMRPTRLANLDLERADWDDLAQAIETRPEGRVTRLEVETSFPWIAEVSNVLGIPAAAAFRLPPPLDHRYLDGLAGQKPSQPPERPLRFPPLKPRRKRSFERDPFGHMDSRDTALYHPLDDYGTVERFARTAAKDPEVDQLRISLYCLGKRNVIAESLIEAANAGKDVAVLLEGRARFDELQNLHWSVLFRRAGVKILPLPSGSKVHAKAFLVRRSGKQYLHLGTGNYNPVNGRLYTDLSLFTSDPDLAADTEEFFSALEKGEAPRPTVMRYGIAARNEIVRSIAGEANPAGHIILKLNHLTDPTVLTALTAAAEAGARVDLIARSTLTLYHDKMNQRSIVGRFLEHSRIAAFKADGAWEVWAGSADWMPRNFEERIELIFPLRDPRIAGRVIRLLRKQLADDVNGFVLRPDGTHEAVWGGQLNSQLVPL